MPCPKSNRGKGKRPAVGRKPLRVLYADDDGEIREIITRFLIHIGCVVQAVESGKKAFEVFQRERFDILITDQHMPDMSGIALAKRIKEIQQGCTVILLKGWESLFDHETTECVDVILVEPLTIEDIEQAVGICRKNRLLH